jgi:hypothetical protein
MLLLLFALTDIVPRSQAREAPPEGWCGETAIQEALLHLGMWAPQKLINQAGRPAHPDLYSSDIPVALNALGVDYTFYSGSRLPYRRWVADAVDAGDPVLAGVKIFPTQHPEWGLDHFVLVVGHGDKGLLVDTTWGDRRWVGDAGAPGLSFKNAFYGIRLRGLKPRTAARLTVISETGDRVRLGVACVGARRVEEIDARKKARFECP